MALVSFRSEDASKLTPAILQAIEARFACALGLQEHQRYCGVHRDTSNLHLHVAYNLIHPQSHRRVEPFRDYQKRDQLCRELEREYGFQPDNGIKEQKPNAISALAAEMEAFSGRQSFAGYCQEHKAEMINQIALAQDWQTIHEILARYAIVIKLHGNGLILQDIHNKRRSLKASSLERHLSKSKLESRLGAYKEAQQPLPPFQEKYTAEALGDAGDLQKYEQVKSAQRQALAEIKSPFLQDLAASKKKWRQKRLAYQLLPLTRKDRAMLTKNACAMERKERQELYADMRSASRTAYSKNFSLNWPQYRRQYIAQRKQLQSSNQAIVQPIQKKTKMVSI
jgi:hypothetical protein